MISTYQSAYGSLDHWATSKEDQMRRSRPSQSQRQRRGEFRFTLLCSAPNRNGQSRTSTATARGQWAVRRSTSQPVGQASAKFNPMWLRNSQLPKSPDPLGFTSYRQ
ncbi:unnamed protein product, partial [Durusdinium trenchii]